MLMSPLERRSTLSLAGIFAVRMLGLFMILPVFSLYAQHLKGSTPALMGVALGIYGLTQALLQIPFGILSDRVGRKPIITVGLVIFILGSLVAGFAHSIHGVIIGRALQGAGAVGSTIIALVADLTREENRTKAMATIGMVIGLSFTLALVLGPILNSLMGVPGIFFLTAVLGVVGIIILHMLVPTPHSTTLHRDAQAVPAQFLSVLKNVELLRLDAGIFALHAILTATFVAIPLVLQQLAGLPEAKQWTLYLPVLFLSFVFMVPFVILAEKKRKMKAVFSGAVGTLFVTQVGLWAFHDSRWLIGLCLLVFFTAFTLLEATLPSLISKVAPAGSKGTAMGVYSSSQFLGIFVGGALGGWLLGQHHMSYIFLLCALLAIIWFAIAITMPAPLHLGTHCINLGVLSKQQAGDYDKTLRAMPGVAEVTIIPEEGMAYLKVDNAKVDKNALNKFSKNST